ncbi:MAG: hypothetical protein Q7S28_01625 [bacterium]|nr:hypothetical protein [bacterium]
MQKLKEKEGFAPLIIIGIIAAASLAAWGGAIYLSHQNKANVQAPLTPQPAPAAQPTPAPTPAPVPAPTPLPEQKPSPTITPPASAPVLKVTTNSPPSLQPVVLRSSLVCVRGVLGIDPDSSDAEERTWDAFAQLPSNPELQKKWQTCMDIVANGTPEQIIALENSFPQPVDTDPRRIKDMLIVKTGLELYYQQARHYPATGADWLALQNAITAIGISIAQVPNDPDSNKSYVYCGNSQQYVVGAILDSATSTKLSSDIDGAPWISWTPPGTCTKVGFTCNDPAYCDQL